MAQARKGSLAPRYHLVDDFLESRPTSDKERNTAAEELSVTPYWVMAVVRLSKPVSMDRTQLLSAEPGDTVSVSKNPADGVRTRGPVLVITDDCVDMTVSTVKSQHTSSFQAQLLGSENNYFSAILPGDWVLAWMVNSQEKGFDIVSRIRKLKPCNKFDDGFKFVGRIHDVRRVRQKDHSGGTVSVYYNVTAVGFQELDTMIFYDPHLAESNKLMGSWLAKLGKGISELLNTPSNDTTSTAAIDINEVIPFFVDLILGDGIPQRYANPGRDSHLRIVTGGVQGESAEAPYAYLVPSEVGQLLGKTSRSKTEILAYADILELLTGVQRFTSVAGTQPGDLAPWSVFVPDGVAQNVQQTPDGQYVIPHKKTGKNMLGQFVPTIPDFSNKPLWTVLQQWLNPTINEMYTAFRVNEAGQVVPTIVVRQMPLSTEVTVQNMESSNIVLTPFMEVPRWVVHPALVLEDQLGRSDSTRFNFVHIYGQSSPPPKKNNNLTYQLVRNPPIRDDLDIQRNGLRPYMTMVACSLEDAARGPRKWMEIASDWLMGQCMTLNGGISMIGIQAPIVHGDNIEWDGVVSHIESVTHHCQRQYHGDRAVNTFTTTLQLTHGVRVDTDEIYRQGRVDDDSYIYSGLAQGDQRDLDPGIVNEGDRDEIKDDIDIGNDPQIKEF